MNCQQLAERIQQLAPHASPRDVARLCLLLTNHVDDLQELQDETRLLQAWTDVSLRLQAATDQHAANLWVDCIQDQGALHAFLSYDRGKRICLSHDDSFA